MRLKPRPADAAGAGGAQLLEAHVGTVQEVAYAVGFSDAAYFSELFRQTYGQPPSEFAAP